jgi:hypothetical protein
MANVKAILIPNSVELTVSNFREKQVTINEPLILFCDAETNESLETFQIVAKDWDDLSSMYRLKVFYTNSIPVGEVLQRYDAFFYGVDADRILYIEKERSAATGALESITA